MKKNTLSQLIVNSKFVIDNRDILINAQTIGYKLLLEESLIKYNLPHISGFNEYYERSLKAYNDNDKFQMEKFKKYNSNNYYILKKICGIKGNKHSKRLLKKRSNRLKKQICRMIKSGAYGKEKVKIKKDLLAFHQEFRDVFVKSRDMLSEIQYNLISDELIFNGTKVKEMYEYNNQNKRYCIKKDIFMTSNEKIEFQMLLITYLFNFRFVYI